MQVLTKLLLALKIPLLCHSSPPWVKGFQARKALLLQVLLVPILLIQQRINVLFHVLLSSVLLLPFVIFLLLSFIRLLIVANYVFPPKVSFFQFHLCFSSIRPAVSFSIPPTLFSNIHSPDVFRNLISSHITCIHGKVLSSCRSSKHVYRTRPT